MIDSIRKRIWLSSRRRTTFTTFFAGIGAGIAVGLSAGVLFAPASGERTRRLLRKEIQRGTRAIGEIGHSASEIGRKVLRPIAA